MTKEQTLKELEKILGKMDDILDSVADLSKKSDTAYIKEMCGDYIKDIAREKGELERLKCEIEAYNADYSKIDCIFNMPCYREFVFDEDKKEENE